MLVFRDLIAWGGDSRKSKKNVGIYDPIDIVIPWVDGNDAQWQEEFNKWNKIHTGTDSNTEIRYRDWDNLQYLFRGIEKFAPWVNKVHLVTCGQKPKWLNLDCKKLNFVTHEEFIPKKYLPTFSVRPIELNIHRIPGLTEKFIYFNDDYFLLRPIRSDMFFKKDLPCDCSIMNVIAGAESTRAYVMLNNMFVINKYFNKRKVIRNKLFNWVNLKYDWWLLRSLSLFPYEAFTGFYNPHAPQPYLKSTFKDIWKKEYKLLSEVSSHKFRDKTDVNQMLFRYWQLAENKFYPINIMKYMQHSWIADDQLKLNIDTIKNQKKSILILNDSEMISNFEAMKQQINSAFEYILPEKSSFEK